MARQGYSAVLDVKLVSGTAVVCTVYDPGDANPTQSVRKSTNFTSWTQITSTTAGNYFEVAYSGATKSYLVYLPWNGTTYTADYLKEITSLSSVADNTAAGSRVWYCADMDEWAGANKYVLAGTSSGLYRSNDAGVNWSSL